MLFELRDYVSGERMGLIKVIHVDPNNDPEAEVKESWTEFNKEEVHDLDASSVEQFVEWHNENRVTQIERVFYEIIQPD